MLVIVPPPDSATSKLCVAVGTVRSPAVRLPLTVTDPPVIPLRSSTPVPSEALAITSVPDPASIRLYDPLTAPSVTAVAAALNVVLPVSVTPLVPNNSPPLLALIVPPPKLFVPIVFVAPALNSNPLDPIVRLPSWFVKSTLLVIVPPPDSATSKLCVAVGTVRSPAVRLPLTVTDPPVIPLRSSTPVPSEALAITSVPDPASIRLYDPLTAPSVTAVAAALNVVLPVSVTPLVPNNSPPLLALIVPPPKLFVPIVFVAPALNSNPLDPIVRLPSWFVKSTLLVIVPPPDSATSKLCVAVGTVRSPAVRLPLTVTDPPVIPLRSSTPVPSEALAITSVPDPASIRLYDPLTAPSVTAVAAALNVVLPVSVTPLVPNNSPPLLALIVPPPKLFVPIVFVAPALNSNPLDPIVRLPSWFVKSTLLVIVPPPDSATSKLCVAVGTVRSPAVRLPLTVTDPPVIPLRSSTPVPSEALAITSVPDPASIRLYDPLTSPQRHRSRSRIERRAPRQRHTARTEQ